MKFLAHEILDPPADCAQQDDCRDAVGNMAILAETMSALTQELVPDSPHQEDDSSERTATMLLANGIISVLPAVMEKKLPSAQRCAGCVVGRALNVLRDTGAV